MTAPTTWTNIGSPTQGTSETLPGLEPGTQYDVDVIATNAAGSATSAAIASRRLPALCRVRPRRCRSRPSPRRRRHCRGPHRGSGQRRSPTRPSIDKQGRWRGSTRGFGLRGTSNDHRSDGIDKLRHFGRRDEHHRHDASATITCDHAERRQCTGRTDQRPDRLDHQQLGVADLVAIRVRQWLDHLPAAVSYIRHNDLDAVWQPNTRVVRHDHRVGSWDHLPVLGRGGERHRQRHLSRLDSCHDSAALAPGVPGAPVAWIITATTVSLQWTPSTSGTAPITYQAAWRVNGTGVWIGTTTPSTATTTTISNLVPGTDYDFQVTAPIPPGLRCRRSYHSGAENVGPQ
jgi:hypothetical protein